MRSCGVLSDGFKIPKCTSHLGIGLAPLILSPSKDEPTNPPLPLRERVGVRNVRLWRDGYHLRLWREEYHPSRLSYRAWRSPAG